MTIAVIKTGGKQYKVEEGQTIKVEKLPSDKKTLEFDDLLSGKKVKASLAGEKKQKTMILKFHAKKHYKRVNGHTQNYSLIKIEQIK